MSRVSLRKGWFTFLAGNGTHSDAPGIYEWRIEGVGLYVGKAKIVAQRLKAYPRNVRRIVEGKLWHGQAGKEYRAVHHALHDAYKRLTEVSVSVLENCNKENLLERERFWITRRREEEKRGGLRVLNTTK